MTEMAKRVVARFLGLAMEHDSPEALKKYLKDHPGADKANHTVKKQDKDEKKDKGTEEVSVNAHIEESSGHLQDTRDSHEV